VGRKKNVDSLRFDERKGKSKRESRCSEVVIFTGCSVASISICRSINHRLSHLQLKSFLLVATVRDLCAFRIK
jgi:hypothetical protein